MSPEQARGEEVDNRSDIFSLGTILYEMLAGGLPFKGEHEAALLYGIVHEEPGPLPEEVAAAYPGLQGIIGRALAIGRKLKAESSSSPDGNREK